MSGIGRENVGRSGGGGGGEEEEEEGAAVDGVGASVSEDRGRHDVLPANLDPFLVHRVSLTDPADFGSLTVSGAPRISRTPTYMDFVEEMGYGVAPTAHPGGGGGDGDDDDGYCKDGDDDDDDDDRNNDNWNEMGRDLGSAESIGAQIARTMRRAFLDMVISAAEGGDEGEGRDGGAEDVCGRPNLEPLRNLVLDLHGAIRSLVPRRVDLHGRLSDEDVRAVGSGGRVSAGEGVSGGAESGLGGVLAFVPLLLRAADALSMLESEDRSRSTREWIDLARPVAAAAATATAAASSAGSARPSSSDEYSAANPLPSLPLPLGLSTPARFVASSAAYLHRKAEMCSSDVADFRLGHVLAPAIAAGGVAWERARFRRTYGDFKEGSASGEDGERKRAALAVKTPVTREWIRRVVARVCDGDATAAASKREELRRSEERRATALRTTGWVDELLFAGDGSSADGAVDGHGHDVAGRSASTAIAAPIAVPEVLSLDVPNLVQIRNVARTSVAGSALALHACTIAGVGDAVLKTDRLPRDVRRRRDGLVRAMTRRHSSSRGGNGGGAEGDGWWDREQYEQFVSEAVVELARTLRPTLDASGEGILSRRTEAVLRGTDPVIKLLDNRMREVFRIMMEWEPSGGEDRVPLCMKTGRDLSSIGRRKAAEGTKTNPSPFKEAAKREFEKRGFAFFAPELASATLLATKVINLVFVLYGENTLERMFLQALEM